MVFTYEGLKPTITTVTDAIVYFDISGMSATNTFTVTFKVSNASGQTLYYQILEKIGATTPNGFAVGSENEGACSDGATADLSYTGIVATLATLDATLVPPAVKSVTVSLTAKAYTDAGYSVLYDSVDLDIVFKYIDSSNGTWTVDASNNFDDGTVQGWAAYPEYFVDVSDTVFVSSPYSLNCFRNGPPSGAETRSTGGTKTVTATGTTTAFFVGYIRWATTSVDDLTPLYFRDASNIKFIPGIPADSTWHKVCIPLTANASNTVAFYASGWCDANADRIDIWLDNALFISASPP